MILRPNFNLTKAEKCLNSLQSDLNALFSTLDYSSEIHKQLAVEDENFINYTQATAEDLEKTYNLINSNKSKEIFNETKDYIINALIVIMNELNKNEVEIDLAIDVNLREFNLLVKAVVYSVEENLSYDSVFNKIKTSYKNLHEGCEYLDELKEIYKQEELLKSLGV